jgi:hypothetical protein
MDDPYDTNLQSNGEFCKICIHYRSNDHFITVDNLLTIIIYEYNVPV